MYRKGRGIDRGILPRHCLYFRVQREDLIGNRINPGRIRASDTSVNWSKYSLPWDVVFDYKGAGIARFMVRDVPKILPTTVAGGTKEHHFRPVHDPLEENYSHCEIRCFKEGEHHTSGKLPVTVKKEFRQILSDRAYVLMLPDS